jgi:dTDP-4-dehydrorhamnose 3,5-epimerase
MKIHPTPIPGALVLEPKVFEDDRGFFMESYSERTFGELGINEKFVQDNHSYSKRGVLRGLHYQVGKPQGKLVRVVSGEVLDVVSDHAHVLYKSTESYYPDLERTILWNDPDLRIEWGAEDPLLSAKDARGTRFRDAEVFG